MKAFTLVKHIYSEIRHTVPPKILWGGLPKNSLEKNTVFWKKGVEIWAFDGTVTVLLLTVLYINSDAYSNAVIVLLSVIVISSVQPRYDIEWNVTVVSYTDEYIWEWMMETWGHNQNIPEPFFPFFQPPPPPHPPPNPPHPTHLTHCVFRPNSWVSCKFLEFVEQ